MAKQIHGGGKRGREWWRTNRKNEREIDWVEFTFLLVNCEKNVVTTREILQCPSLPHVVLFPYYSLKVSPYSHISRRAFGSYHNLNHWQIVSKWPYFLVLSSHWRWFFFLKLPHNKWLVRLDIIFKPNVVPLPTMVVCLVHRVLPENMVFLTTTLFLQDPMEKLCWRVEHVWLVLVGRIGFILIYVLYTFTAIQTFLLNQHSWLFFFPILRPYSPILINLPPLPRFFLLM